MLNQVKEVPNTVGQGIGAVAGTAHKAVQAGLGAAVLIQEDVTTRIGGTKEEVEIVVEESAESTSRLADKLIARGDEVQKEWMDTLNGWVEPRRKQVEDTVKELATKAETRLQKGVEGFLVRANVPTATDIQDMNKKIGALGRKIDRLRRAQEDALKKEA